MKTLLTLLCLLPVWVMGQASEPFKKASVIEIHTTLTPQQAYKAVALALQDSGYGIASSDATLLSISTNGKTGRNIVSNLNTSVRGDSLAVIVLRGTFILSGFDASPIEYRGMKGSPVMLAWDQLEAVAKRLPAQKVLYR
jgi:hypothetical protein